MIKKRHSKYLFIIIGIFLVMAVISGLVGFKYYNRFFSPNTHIEGAGKYVLYIPTGCTYDGVMDSLEKATVLANMKSFRWVADFMKYYESVRAGRYILTEGMSNRAIVNKLKSGSQDPLNIVIGKKRTKEDLAGLIGKRLELDSASFVNLLNNQDYLDQYDLTPETVMAIFIQNTYEFFWNTSAEGFIERMKREYDRFWNEERKSLADLAGLSPLEVIIVASIVEEETIKEDEKSRVAGVYLNRLKKNWKLQADPTVKFSLKDFGLQRVLYSHLEYDSPYNTYRIEGLPPGPICLPGPGSIQAVLNAEQHDYMFMCAKEDFSGYHNFAKTNAQHEQNSRKYQAALNRRNIR